MSGKSRVNQMDYAGAIEAFEKASEVNPRSGAAHFELAWLFEKVEPDPAAAIYHYEKYLKLRPEAENGEVVKQHILACKQELARAVSLGPVSERQQREFEQVAEENKRLREEVERWRAYYAKSPGQTNSASPEPTLWRTTPASASAQLASAGNGPANPTPSGRPSAAAAMAARIHTIKSGETPSRIAREYGVKVTALMAANPRLDARRLRPGQSLHIPAS